MTLPFRNRSFALAVGLTSVVALLACSSGESQAQQPHAAKVIFADQESWPATSPGSISLPGFRPFRAVYDRQYTQGSGPGRGEKRQDRVIVYADEVGWDGERAVAITVLDSAAAEYADTNLRALLMVASLEDLTVRFEIGPVPGKAKDYYLSRLVDEEVRFSRVDTATQTLQGQKAPAPKNGFGPGSWVMASLDLAEGMKIRLDPYFSPQSNPISQSSYGRVIGRKTITDATGEDHEAWVVETPGWYGPSSPKVLQLHLKNSPPYYLGTETYNYETDERSRFVWLRSAEITKP